MYIILYQYSHADAPSFSEILLAIGVLLGIPIITITVVVCSVCRQRSNMPSRNRHVRRTRDPEDSPDDHVKDNSAEPPSYQEVQENNGFYSAAPPPSYPGSPLQVSPQQPAGLASSV